MTDPTRQLLIMEYLACARMEIDKAAGLVSEMPKSRSVERTLAGCALNNAMKDLREAKFHLGPRPATAAAQREF